jgi:7-carboxy-7-deazaguanine synthase
VKAIKQHPEQAVTDPMSSETTADSSRLRITEIFHSLQGESSYVGLPTVFVRLTGCPLRCNYCDTSYAFSGGEWMSLTDIRAQVSSYAAHQVCVTGGEPLAQKACIELLRTLCDDGYRVSLETSGAMDICDVDSRVSRIMDLKTPASGEEGKNRYANIDCLGPQDEVKFVICNRDDYEWSRSIIEEYQLLDKAQVLLSPEHQNLQASELADWILQDRLNVRFQLQLHKYLWNNEPGR